MDKPVRTSDRKHISAASFVAVSALLLNAIWGLINIPAGNLWIAAENMAVAGAFGAAFLANRWGYHLGASISIGLLFLAHQGFALYIVGFDSGAYFFFMLGVMGPFLIFRSAELPIAIAFSMLSGMAFLASIFWQEYLPARYVIGSLETMEWLNAAFVLVTLFAMTAFFVMNASAGEEALEDANRKINNLLKNVLPEAIAERLTTDPEERIAEYFKCVSVGFLDVVGFTTQASKQRPSETVAMLDRLFSAFDQTCSDQGILKIKTIGDGYMFAAGVPDSVENHQVKIIKAGLEFIRIAQNQGVNVRVGAHCGEVVAGVIGRIRFQYDLLGDTVNIASRMESTGLPGAIQVSEEMIAHIENTFDCTPRGEISVMGKGEMRTWMISPKLSDPNSRDA